MSLSTDNLVFASLETYIYKVLNTVHRDPAKTNTFIKLHEESDSLALAFLLTENLDEAFYTRLHKEVDTLFNQLLDEGFFLLHKHKTALTLGKLYTVMYCKNGVRLVSRNLVTVGTLFVCAKEHLYQIDDHLFSYKIQASNKEHKEQNTGEVNPSYKKLIEFLPKLFILTNTDASKEAVILNTNLVSNSI